MASNAPAFPRRHAAARGAEARRYTLRRPEASVLYQAVQAELETFLARAHARKRPVPRFVEREFRGFLGCGVLAHGFVRVHCDECGLDRVVAFSCKGRGFCPSCGGRRMADTAAHLVDRVLPEVPIRQWVLSLPFALRYRLAYDATLTSAVLAIFVRTVFASLQRRARKHWGVPRGQCGAVTFVQRFGDALNLNVHFHSLVLDGVYAAGPSGALRFHALPPPGDAEVGRVAGQVARRIVRLLERSGLAPDADPAEADPLPDKEPLLALLYAASVASRIATGRRAGQRVLRVGDRIDVDDVSVLEGERCASVGGVSLHANVAVPARDRRRLERLARYVARPPVSTQRLSRLATAGPATGGIALNLAGLAVVGFGLTLAGPAMLLALLRFPRGELIATPSTRLGPWLFAVIAPLTVSALAGFPLRKAIGIPLLLVALLAAFVTVLVVIARRYRGADPIGRRQLRWVVLGIYGALAPPLAVTALLLVDGLFFGEWRRLQPLFLASSVSAVLIPICLLVAVARYNLFDVDRLLSATASYNVLLVGLTALGLALAPRFGELSSHLLGVDPEIGQVVLSLALAGIAVPAHQRLRPRIERLLFKERYALDYGIAELLRTLAVCDSPRALTELMGEQVERLFRSESCVVYARDGGRFAPVFVVGRMVPQGFEAEGPLVATLRERREPLALSSAGRTPDPVNLGPFERAALAALEAEVVVPVRRDDVLLAFLCIGPRRSGDVYTRTDLSLLAAVAAAASSQLHRFEQEEVIQAGRAMQASLRRYVPGAVAEQLASGNELASGEREVTVLFVDLRGYTSFSEARHVEEIFATVNRYTERVSKLVHEHGGAVVEFHGDGLLAVFGAPMDLPHKERSAVEAAREIVRAMEALSREGPRLSVGVGVATGPAFVGNIRGHDRQIWTVLGNSTNLAARLQASTRDLDASIAIDSTTHERADDVCADFAARPALPIRGRSTPIDVFILPMQST